MLEHFQKNSADIATPTGPSALDEPPPTTKARMEAKTYNAHKPAKFAVRFYVVTFLCGHGIGQAIYIKFF